MVERYFDNAATTPLDPRVFEEMRPFLTEDFGNPNSIHAFGRKAAQAVDLARERLASAIQAEDPEQITFTSGATESNNWVLRAFSSGAFSPFEHSAVREPALHQGFEILPNEGYEIERTDRRDLVSVMSVNNETGAIWNIADIAPYAIQHVDATQQVGKLPVQVEDISYLSLSAHKFYGPKGIGALYSRDLPPVALMQGGEQENGYRAGTLNVAAIVGMGAAVTISADQMAADTSLATQLRAVMLENLAGCTDFVINESETNSPYIFSLSFEGIEGETLVIETDRAGYAISAGAACSSRATEPSHVLTALGLPESYRRGTVRISFGRFNTLDEAAKMSKSLLTSVEMIRRMR